MASVGCQTQNALKGPQDMLTMSPREFSFFRAVYSRHTNFASGEAEQSTNNTPAFGRSNIQTTIARAGDLLSQMYLTVHLPAIGYAPVAPGGAPGFNLTTANFTSWCNGIGFAMINDISVVIGQHEFDTQSGRFMYMREQVAHKPGHELTEEIGLYPNIETAAIHSLVPQKLHVPLQFWFNNWLEQSIPMIGLYWHEVRMDLSLRTLAECLQVGSSGTGTPTLPTATTALEELHYLCNFQYLDRPERAMFANQKLEQIFVQVQYLGEESFTAAEGFKQVNIRWNQPVTDLMFVFQHEDAIAAHDWFNFAGVNYAPLVDASVPGALTFPAGTLAAPPFQSMQIFLNNNQRTIPLSVENVCTLPAQRGHLAVPHGTFIGTYPFGTEVDGLLHSGSVNFSRMDTAYIRFQLWSSVAPVWSFATNPAGAVPGGAPVPLAWNYPGRIHIYARNFNLCKLSLGMLGVKFAS